MKQLRIATLGDWNKYFSYFLYGSMEGAIRCGAWFRPIPLFYISLGLVEEQIDFFKPHILMAHCIFNRSPHNRDDVFDLLRRTRRKWGTYVCYHMGDARSEPRYPHDISDIVDLSLVNNGELDKWSRIWNVPCIHWPYPALYQKDIAEVDKRFQADVVFTGSLSQGEGHHRDRTNFVNQLPEYGIELKTYPDPTWGNSRFLTAEVSASSNVILGTQMGGDVHLYQDVRPFQYIGAGALYFHEKHRNMRYFFEPGFHYVEYDGVEDFIEKYNNLYKKKKKNKNEARRIRMRGFEYAQEYHSTKRRVQAVIDTYEGKELDHELATICKEGG